jgi:hypothetical protein
MWTTAIRSVRDAVRKQAMTTTSARAVPTQRVRTNPDCSSRLLRIAQSIAAAD